VEWLKTHERQAVERIKASQAYVLEEYCPRRIAKLWLQALSRGSIWGVAQSICQAS